MRRDIFISYRRDDDAGMALALYEHLKNAFTPERVFMDVEDGLQPGEYFAKVLKERVRECRIVLAVIGRNWLSVKDAQGRRRLDNPEDFVRIEIESALKLDKLVIPVLINDTEMPQTSELPESMQSLAERQAVWITGKRLRSDAHGLIKKVSQQLREAAPETCADDPSEGSINSGSPVMALGATPPARSEHDFKVFPAFRYLFEHILSKQPLWMQAATVYAFALLFVYLIVVAMQASIILPARVQVKLAPDELKSKRAGGYLISDNSYSPPKQGYLIGHNGFQYALNGNGEVRLDLTFSTFVMALIRRSLAVDIIASGGISSPKSFDITGLGHGSMFFEAQGNPTFGAVDGSPTTEHFGPAVQFGLSDFIGTANAAVVQGSRLYLQSVTIPEDVNVTAIKASLTLGKTTYALQALSGNLTLQNTSQLIVKSGASVVQDYRMFFPLPEAAPPEGAKITFQSGNSLLGLGYFETFNLPDTLQLGTPVEIKGDAGTIIVVQLTLPVDVVFFQQLNTNNTTDAIAQNARKAGYAPRIQNTGAIAPATYNIIYAGTDVPISAVREMVRIASEARVDLRFIQPQVPLSNGLQNQIQLAASPKVTCLPIISAAALNEASSSDSDFMKLVTKLPRPGCS